MRSREEQRLRAMSRESARVSYVSDLWKRLAQVAMVSVLWTVRVFVLMFAVVKMLARAPATAAEWSANVRAEQRSALVRAQDRGQWLSPVRYRELCLVPRKCPKQRASATARLCAMLKLLTLQRLSTAGWLLLCWERTQTVVALIAVAVYSNQALQAS